MLNEEKKEQIYEILNDKLTKHKEKDKEKLKGEVKKQEIKNDKTAIKTISKDRDNIADKKKNEVIPMNSTVNNLSNNNIYYKSFFC